MQRHEWTFKYAGWKLAEAAIEQRAYREQRLAEREKKKEAAEQQIRWNGIEITESIAEKLANYSNPGFGPQITVDQKLLREYSECIEGIKRNRELLRQYDGWIQVLQANPDQQLELDHEDWLFFFGKK